MPAELIDWTLYSCSIGRLDTLTAEYPDSTPVNYAYFDGKVYIHSRNSGAKVEDIRKNQNVAFAVDRFNQTRWLSVNIIGTARLIKDQATMDLLMSKYNAALNTAEPAKVAEAVQAVTVPGNVSEAADDMVVIEITPGQITGRMNNVKLNIPKLPYTLEDSLKPGKE
jgi:nitroimidazol reductase NimA-like FMN-containing flavoprotein (pyridoxamine 5'-phosphate oxidase superfamily)